MQRIFKRAAEYGEENKLFTFTEESRKKLMTSLHSIEELLAMSEEKFTALSGGLSPLIYRAVIDSALDAYPVVLHSGTALMEIAQRTLATFSFGHNSSLLDDITHGGIWSSEVTEIVGPSGCGKTQLCLQIAGQHASSQHLPCQVLYIDTSLSFNPDRLMEMHRHWTQYDSKIAPAAVMLSRIQFVPAADCFELLGLLEQTRSSLVRAHTRRARELRMIVIDSIAAVVSPIIGIPGGRGHAILSELSFMLKSLARRHNIAVIVTNNVVANRVSDVRSDVQPALGEFWSHVPDTRIVLREASDPMNDSEEKDRKLNHRRSLIGQLNKSSKFPVGEEVSLNIRAMGVTNVSVAR